MSGNIPQSASATGEYISVEKGELSFDARAWVTPSNLATLSGVKMRVSDERDISSAVNASGIVLIRDIQIEYPRGDLSVLLPLGEVVVEYRPSAGKSQTRRGMAGKSEFVSGYLATYASIGIPDVTMEFIERRVKGAINLAGSVENPKLRHNGGYSWMPIKLPNEIKVSPRGESIAVPTIDVFLSDSKGTVLEVGNILEVFRALKRNLMGYATVSIRLKHSRARQQPNTRSFEMAMTLAGFQITDVTELSSPPLGNITRGHLIDIHASDALMAALTQNSDQADAGDEEVGPSAAGVGGTSTRPTGE
jgi:hypothetical protein